MAAVQPRACHAVRKDVEPFQFTRAAAQDGVGGGRSRCSTGPATGMVYCDAFADEAEVEQALRTQIDGAPLADPNPLRFIAGTALRHGPAIALRSAFPRASSSRWNRPAST